MAGLTREVFQVLAVESVLVRMLLFNAHDVLAVTGFLYHITRDCLYVVQVEWDNDGPSSVTVRLKASGAGIAAAIDELLGWWSRPGSIVTIWAKPYQSAYLLVSQIPSPRAEPEHEAIFARVVLALAQALEQPTTRRKSVLKRLVRRMHCPK